MIGRETWATKPGRSLAWLLLLLFCLSQPAWGAGAVEVRRLGLSKVADDTLLTVILDRAATPRVSSREVSGKPQLVVDFPGARAGQLPRHLEGDELLVQQVLTETAAPGGGVRIVLDLFPERPFTYWKMNRPGTGGQTLFILGLKSDPKARPVQARVVPPTEPEPIPAAPPPGEEFQEREPIPNPSPPGEDGGGYQEPRGGSVAPGSFAELRRLMPKAANLLQGLETEGWAVSESNRYDRPGRRFSRDFTLTNHKYPELVVKIAYLPANTPNTPNIDIIMLSTEKLTGETATQYQGLRQWSFSKIKEKYEDIGDFFDDALKPLRVKLREQTKSVALRDAAVFQNFLKLACPNNPQVADQVMNHVRAKVSPRFEGVQFTVSENPLVILNMVDFLFVKVYFLDNSPGGAQ